MYQKFNINIKMVRDKTLKYPKFNMPSKIFDAYKKLQENDVEEFHVLYLDTGNNLIGARMISRGTLNSSLVHPREVFKLAILKNAHSIICVHNHPSGRIEPSREDIDVTYRLIEAGKILGIGVLDHIIIGDNAYCSMQSDGIVEF